MKTPSNDLLEKLSMIRDSDVFSIRSDNLPTWCPGCGYFGIHHGINSCIQRMQLPHHKIVVVSGIGCAGRYPYFTNTYGLHAAHGRALPVATGIKLANPDLTVLVVGGDGDGLAIGGGHLPHIARRDINVNYLLFDNSVYGLTKGQPSPSTAIGFKSKASPKGHPDQPLDATLLSLSYGASFVARLFAGDSDMISHVLQEGINHNGFSFFHIYTSCVTFDKQFKTWENLKQKIHPVPDNHNVNDRKQSILHVLEDNYSMGIIYKRG